MPCSPLCRLLLALTAAVCFLFPWPVHAADYISCATDANCSIGEFLYDDNYTPIATASCALSSTEPDGTPLLTDEAMTAHSDGWYDYSLNTTGYTQGLYHSEICCTHLDEYLCIDKSFTVSSTSLNTQEISDAVWNATASGYTQTGSFGTMFQTLTSLPANIWSYTTRSLTSFGSLVSSIWNYSDRRLTSEDLAGGDLATEADIVDNTNSIKNDLNNRTNNLNNQILTIHSALATLSGTPADNETLNQIYAQVLDNRNLLEALVNEPIVKTFVDDGSPPPDLNAKLEQTKVSISEAFALNQQVASRLGVINLKLASMPLTSVTAELSAIINLIHDPNSPDHSLTNSLAWLEKAWGSRLTENSSQEAGAALASLKLAQSKLLGSATTEPARTDLVNAISAANNLEASIGDVSHTMADSTLYGHLAKVQALAAALDQNDQALADLLTRWAKEPPLNKSRTIVQLENRILAVNQLSNAKSLLNREGETPDLSLKNQVLGLQAISGINRLLLARMYGEPISNIWLENGSVIFRALIINPSERISQRVPLKYYLPREVRLEDVIKHNPELTLKYDANESAVYVEGDFELAPGESRSYMVEVNDIFTVSPATLDSLKNQAAELLKPLLKTSFYGQGATLKSDIDVILDKIIERQTSAQTPEGRIRAYRENQIELAGAKQKLDQLKTLIADAGSTSSIFGFVGGIQAVALWGIVIIIIAGFVFLTIYLRVLRQQAFAQAGYAPAPTAPIIETNWPQAIIRRYVTRLDRLKFPTLDPGTRFFQIIFTVLAATVLTAIVITSIIANPTAVPAIP